MAKYLFPREYTESHFRSMGFFLIKKFFPHWENFVGFVPLMAIRHVGEGGFQAEIKHPRISPLSEKSVKFCRAFFATGKLRFLRAFENSLKFEEAANFGACRTESISIEKFWYAEEGFEKSLPQTEDDQPMIVRFLGTGWGKDTGRFSMVENLEFELSRKGLSRCRCATILGSKFPEFCVQDRIGLIFATNSVIKAFDRDIQSWQSGRRGGRTEMVWAKKSEISLEKLLAEGSKQYPEVYVRNGARPIGIMVNDPALLTGEILNFAHQNNLKTVVRGA